MPSRRQVLAASVTALAVPSLVRAESSRVLKFIPQSDLTVIDPIWSTAYIARNHGYMVFDTLFGMDAAYRIQPQMVGAVKIEDDGRRWDLILRDGLMFHDGETVLARVALDISGRPLLVWKAGFTQPRLGEMDSELFEHWFHSFAQAAGITLHAEVLYGTNNHHIIEGLFKALARALRAAVEVDPRKHGAVPSTKGLLGDGTLDG